MLVLKQEDGSLLQLHEPPTRIVSLVPSITENLILFGKNPVGRTSFCIEPQEAVKSIAVVGGTKTPNLLKIKALNPDLVIVNKEENIKEHVEALRSEGLKVWVTYPQTVEDVLSLMHEMLRVCGESLFAIKSIESLKEKITQKKKGEEPLKINFLVPIWKDPWMASGKNTFISALLEFCGGENVFSDPRSRYPEFSFDRLSVSPDLVILPSEPYAFTQEHIPEVKKHLPKASVACFSGEDLCWSGPRTAKAIDSIHALFAEVA